ncbi:hypothetical protein A3B84_00960 [Candidatus Nomurabacteria bacterium RIFCSPHIGHO2_02_FULL_35_13]|uniref:Uncharacterized protein n=2 Tax=Candidatus Nomuraibacteriota TaxID=1752729 RepID=A0A1F6VPH8_9BACT|nr:MAG: hypothetical protein UR88_C0007G0014 [Candidatus Nomurabacteria bacterium GW2011_GWA1_35_8]OGI71538.1 MAG: hypothetical protein A3B84_00960 [Candidatus Nomurabacteria bacterium RIFCSPHIGHO2_02_FULL_35_13]
MKKSAKLFGWTLIVLGVYVFITLYNIISKDVFVESIQKLSDKNPLAAVINGTCFIVIGMYLRKLAKSSPKTGFPKIAMAVGFICILFGLIFINTLHILLSYLYVPGIYDAPPFLYIITGVLFMISGLIILFSEIK